MWKTGLCNSIGLVWDMGENNKQKKDIQLAWEGKPKVHYCPHIWYLMQQQQLPITGNNPAVAVECVSEMT